MEYVEGASLQAVVATTGPMPVSRAAHYARQAASGLQYAHEKGLVHRDIKPANLLVDRAGTVKILDMGLALFYANEDDSILTKDVLGTLDYLAPEQARDSHAVDIRADIYSLGGTLYFLLTGKTPLDKLGIDPALLGQVGFSPRPIRTIRRDVPEALAEVIARMMARGPENRYQTPNEVADALAPWTAIPIPAPSDKEMPHLSPAARGDENGFGPYPSRSRSIPWTWIGLAAVFLLALLGLLLFLK
jgi:serine/threonine protein kinase